MSGHDLSTIPVVPAPPGQVSNLTDPHSRAWIHCLAIYTTFPLAIIFVLLRFGALSQLRQKLRLEDCGFCSVTSSVDITYPLLTRPGDGMQLRPSSPFPF
ncbi:hypothetical protein F4802DRAFT_579022 [Xylaria palmicola]|nr:hypothetical protein F4802DRAFT_579022 [Xylaria palmicola]